MYICEKCGKEHDGSFGSGRFCSRQCANSHKKTDLQKQHISEGLLKETVCKCNFCDREFTTLIKKSQHERYCQFNPDRELINKGAVVNHEKKLSRLAKVEDYKTRKYIELDITYQELLDYRLSHPVCEICGKSIQELSTNNSKTKYKNLSIDHDHKTNKFRGLLCMTCNRELGWYENNKDAIENYLNKDH